jgi:hypothetical protein
MRLILASCLTALAFARPGDASDQARARTVENRIVEGLTITTTVSSETPFVGEQVSFAYRLRSTLPLAAIDLDPQSFDGFWTTVVPVSEIEGGATNTGRVRELLLRHVVAWPLRTGRLPVAPLRAKIRLNNRVRPAGDWDYVAESAPFDVTARAVPGAESGSLPLVGRLSVSMTRAPESGTVLLEASGTANLSFFDPRSWLGSGGHPIESAVLVHADEISQRVFRGGTLDLNLLQRRKWQLATKPGTDPLTPPRLACFDPVEEVWADVATEAATVSAGNREAPTTAAPRQVPERRGWIPRLWLAVPGAAAIGAVILAAIATMVRRRRRGRPA